MAGERGTRVVKPRGGVAIPLVVLAIVLGVGLFAWTRGDLNGLICDGECGPDHVVPPRALTTDTVPSDLPAGVPSAGEVDPEKLSAAITRGLRAPVLGPRVGFSAISPSDGTELVSSRPGTYVPASTTKVLTAFAALSVLGPQSRFTTRAVGFGDRIVLVGGGDPYLVTRVQRTDARVVRADLATLARRTAAALSRAGTDTVTLQFDASRFTGPDTSPAWEPTYVSQDIVTPVSALWADQAVQPGARARDPAASAARIFARLLEDRGIEVSGEPTVGRAPAGGVLLGAVRSATVGQIVEHLMRTSNNEASEVMLRQVAIAAGEPASFAGGARAVVDVLETADIDTEGLVLTDGSGLSRGNRISPLTLAETIGVAASTPRTSTLVTDLPVSGFTGTLVSRFARLESALGTVRAKTGTLTGIHSLAGYAVDADGRPVVFAVMADRTDRAAPLEAQAALDRIAADIATCHCG